MSQPTLVSLAVQDGVGVITVNNPPVNALSAGVPEGIATCLATALPACAQAAHPAHDGYAARAAAGIRPLQVRRCESAWASSRWVPRTCTHRPAQPSGAPASFRPLPRRRLATHADVRTISTPTCTAA